MRVCDYIAHELFRRGVRHIYGLMGGGASGLNDGFIKHGALKYICFHNEQGAGHAALGEAKLTGNISVVNPTTGCGGTNCITSLLSAWQDSVPVIFISGNVGYGQCSRPLNIFRNFELRKYGIQEHDIIETVKSITKYAEFIYDARYIKSELNKAITIATSGRPGPVWLDIPSNIQTAELPDEMLEKIHNTPYVDPIHENTDTISRLIDDIHSSSKPIVVAGQGIKQSKTRGYFLEFIDTYKIPFVSTYGGRDITTYSHNLNIGAIGIKGSRAGNFAMQTADLIITLGCSLNNSHIGYDVNTWSANSKKYFVNIDYYDMHKYAISDTKIFPFEAIQCDLVDFFTIVKGFHHV